MTVDTTEVLLQISFALGAVASVGAAVLLLVVTAKAYDWIRRALT